MSFIENMFGDMGMLNQFVTSGPSAFISNPVVDLNVNMTPSIMGLSIFGSTGYDGKMRMSQQAANLLF